MSKSTKYALKILEGVKHAILYSGLGHSRFKALRKYIKIYVIYYLIYYFIYFIICYTILYYIPPHRVRGQGTYSLMLPDCCKS